MLVGKELYRALLREAKHLPDNRLSEHFTVKVRTAFRDECGPESSESAMRRIKRAQKLLRHLQAANEGYLHSITRAYETAYGVRGKIRHAILEPFLEAGLQKRNFPPPLAAVVTSPYAHTSRAPSPADLVKPPLLPERADPASEQARLLGPLASRRIKAIKRRYWNLQTGKIHAPMAVKVVQGLEEVGDAETASRLLAAQAGLRISPDHLVKGWRRAWDVQTKSASPNPKLPPRRLQTAEQRQNRPPPLPSTSPRRIVPDDARHPLVPAFDTTKWKKPRIIRPRLLRRRVQLMLQKMPTLTVRLPEVVSDHFGATREPGGKDRSNQPKFTLALSDKAAGEKGRYREMTEEERWWLEKESVPPLKVKGQGKKK